VQGRGDGIRQPDAGGVQQSAGFVRAETQLAG
jgi:hypothetical protein